MKQIHIVPIQVVLLTVIAVMGALLFINQRALTPEQKFWGWFEQNQDFYYSYSNQDYSPENKKKLDNLEAELKKIHPALSYELLPTESDGRRGFSITAGYPHVFETLSLVDFMVQRAPKLSKWHIYAYRQRKEKVDVVNQTTGMRMGTDTVFFTYDPNNWLMIKLYIDKYVPSKSNEYMYQYLLDNVVGEDAMVSTVFVENVLPLSEATTGEKILPIMQLRTLVDDYPCGGPNGQCHE